MSAELNLYGNQVAMSAELKLYGNQVAEFSSPVHPSVAYLNYLKIPMLIGDFVGFT